MKLKQKILMISLIPLLLSVSLIGYAVLQMKSLKSSTTVIVQMLVNVEELNSSAKSLQKSLNAYSLNASAANANEVKQDLQFTGSISGKLEKKLSSETQIKTIKKIILKYNQLSTASSEAIKEANQAEAKRQSLRTKGMANDVIELKRMISDEYNSMQLRLQNHINWIVSFSIIAALILVGASVVTSMIFTERIVRPIRLITNHAGQIAAGNLAVSNVTVTSKDEISVLNQSFQEMVRNLRRLIEQVSNSSSQVAASAEELMASAEETMKGTEQITTSIQQVSAGAEQQTVKSGESARAAEESTMGVKKIAENAASVLELSRSANDKTQEGSEYVKETLHQMDLIHASVEESDAALNELNKRSKEIGDILNLITGIANQTNLLALNAAIEASRAGEAGKGFAVVADEVRKLAEQTRDFVAHIAEITTEMQQDTGKSVESMQFVKEKVAGGLAIASRTEETFHDILDSVENVGEQMQSITAISSEITNEVSLVSKRVIEMSDVAGSTSLVAAGVASASEQQLASMEEVNAAAASLANLAEELQNTISKFHL
ncbi:methyl-accepting chemotaxis protein [Bacillus sp. T33-2]|nr:methyl-accepting chemotaxis protein [Bacillus sp. T33-2]PLR99095.1 methyl-accepting chemotaxis protein [Bacillus sp. T33-2]